MTVWCSALNKTFISTPLRLGEHYRRRKQEDCKNWNMERRVAKSIWKIYNYCQLKLSTMTCGCTRIEPSTAIRKWRGYSHPPPTHTTVLNAGAIISMDRFRERGSHCLQLHIYWSYQASMGSGNLMIIQLSLIKQNRSHNKIKCP